jgi:selenoprotein W-related protein
LKEFEYQIEGLNMVPSDGGRFEVSINGSLIYSKLAMKRHAEPGEVLRLARQFSQG